MEMDDEFIPRCSVETWKLLWVSLCALGGQWNGSQWYLQINTARERGDFRNLGETARNRRDTLIDAAREGTGQMFGEENRQAAKTKVAEILTKAREYIDQGREAIVSR